MKLTHFIPLILSIATAHAATLNVTTTADTGAGSLRTQIAAAVTGDTVAITATGMIALTTGEIAITGKNLTIAGPGANSVTITTNATTRALKIVNAQCTISGITFNNCKGLVGDVDTGGAIAVDNFTSGGTTLVTTVTDCAFTNKQSGWGGAFDVFQGGLVMARCTFSANAQNGIATGQPGGGAIYNYGAGFANPPTVTAEHCTFVANVDAAGAGGAIKDNYTGSYHTAAKLKNCLLVNNQTPATVLRNFSGNPTGVLTATYTSLGGNVADEAVTSAQFMTGSADKVSNATVATTVSPTIALNGAGLATHAITRGSPAQRSGATSTVATDQRGAPRHAKADAGAFELIEPELGVTVAAAPIGEGGTIAFGSTPFDTPLAATVTIRNTQTSSFTSGPLALANVAAPAGYSVTGFPTPALANGQSASFTVALTAANTGIVNAPLTFAGNDSFNPALATAAAGSPNAHLINLTALVTDTMNHWRVQNFGPGATNSGDAADNANPTGDGIANLLKYGLGLNPFTSSPIALRVETDIATRFLRMTVTKNPAATDVMLNVQVNGARSFATG